MKEEKHLKKTNGNKGEQIYIAVAGHTNTGKTTLIRTLTKSPVGEVGDRANVTQRSAVHYHESLLAYFIDTPGFRFAGVYNFYLDNIITNPNFTLQPDWQEKVEFERDAVEAIKSSNVVLYVASLQVVPDDQHKEEIKLVKRLQPQIVGILNFSHSVAQNKLEERVAQWKKAFSEVGVDHVLVFDTHWDRYSRVNKIYETIANVLSQREKEIFLRGVAHFKERQQQINREAAKYLAESIQQLQRLEFKYKKSVAPSAIEEKIREKVAEITEEFVEKVSLLYQIAAHYPMDSLETIRGRLRTLPNWKNRLSLGGTGVTLFGGGGAALGAAVGAIVAAVLSGGLGAGGGAVLGAQVGGAIGGGIGALFALDGDADRVMATLTSDEIGSNFKLYIAIMWGVSVASYGRASILSKESVSALVEKVGSFCLQECNGVDWKNISTEDILNITHRLWRRLEES